MEYFRIKIPCVPSIFEYKKNRLWKIELKALKKYVVRLNTNPYIQIFVIYAVMLNCKSVVRWMLALPEAKNVPMGTN